MAGSWRWVFTKHRGGKIVIHKIWDSRETPSYSGQQIPIDREDREFLHDLVIDQYGISLEPLKHGRDVIIDKKDHEELYNKLMKYIAGKLYDAKQNKPDQYNKERSDRVACRFDGGYMLLRSSSRDKIWIASRAKSRSQKFPYGYTSINHVCIDDAHKQRFFRTADSFHNPVGTMHWLELADGDVFTQWSNYMDDEYERQADLDK